MRAPLALLVPAVGLGAALSVMIVGAAAVYVPYRIFRELFTGR